MELRYRIRYLSFFLTIFAVSLLCGVVFGIFVGYLKSAPALDEVNFNPQLTTYIYDCKGRLITNLYTQNRIEVSLEDMPEDLLNAVVAIEDHLFWKHHGINFTAILRALWVNLRTGTITQGGSTITQQLAKNAFVGDEQSFSRKIKELLWAIQIERKYSKEEILETYLNWIYLGPEEYGVEVASQKYFGKSVSELTLPEAATIAGLVRNPGYYSPITNRDAAIRRRNLVLRRMEELGYISAARAEEARAAELVVKEQARNEPKAPYFVDYVRRKLLEKYGTEKVYAGGLKVYTTLDLDIQKTAEQVMLENMPNGRVDQNGLEQPQGALISLETGTGHIKAMVGGRGTDKYNRAVQAERQPGSAFKPFLYSAAIDLGYTPATIVVDEPVTFKLPGQKEPYSPENWDHQFRGPVTLRDALENSINVVAVKLLDQIGTRTVIDYARNMGISTLVTSGKRNDLGIAIALGGLTRGVTPLEMAAAYGVIANQGIWTEPVAILRVIDASGHVLEENNPERRIVFDPQTAYIMTDMLRGVIERGTGRKANIGRPAAGKTGTTQDYTNAWFVGFTPELITAVYLGEDMPKSMIYDGDIVGSSDAARIWGVYMKNALKNRPISDFPRPDGIVGGILIDKKTGLLATPWCPRDQVRYEMFVEGTEPQTYCTMHGADQMEMPAPGPFRHRPINP